MVRYYELFLSSHVYERRFLFRFDQRKNLHCLRSIVQTQLEQEVWGKVEFYNTVVVFTYGFTGTGWAIKIRIHFSSLTVYNLNFPAPIFGLTLDLILEQKVWGKVEFYSGGIHLQNHCYRVVHTDQTSLY